MRKIGFVLGGVAAAVVLSCSSQVVVNVQTNGQAPAFELENIAGGTTGSADLKGKVSVVDIWATWCEPCITEIPKFNRLFNEYKDKDVRIVGITAVSPQDAIAPTAKQYGMKYTILVGDDTVVDGFGGVIGWPTTFVLTKDWTIYKKYVGALPDKEARIKKDIDTLLSRSH
jgi:cytochrome c biogenesis protein CcmG, thiol:disulfide interchange protein DsbE